MAFIENEEFVEWVKGKSVAIVGPAASAEKFSNGGLIDSYDIVCRIKSMRVPEDKTHIYGTRLDVLYTDNNETNDIFPGDLWYDKGDKRNIIINPETMKQRFNIMTQQVKYVVSTYPRAEWFFPRFVAALEDIAHVQKVRILPDEPYMSIRKETNRPNGGFSAIIDMVNLPVSEIFITGLDFYRSLYKPDYLNSLYTKETILGWTADGETPDGIPDQHDPDLQFKYFKKHFWPDPRIKVDPFMDMVLRDPRYEDFETAMALLEETND